MSTTTEPTVKLTERAATEVTKMTGGAEGKGLRLFVETGGCSGLNYGMELAEAKEGDEVSEQFGVGVFIEELAGTYLAGSVIDWSDSLTNTGFTITNPNAKQTCGCGKSFEA